jgi:hypothetical protein
VTLAVKKKRSKVTYTNPKRAENLNRKTGAKWQSRMVGQNYRERIAR